MAIRWKAWYADNSVRSSATDSTSDLPRDGVVVIMLWTDGGQVILEGTDYYFVLDEVWGQAMPNDYPPGTPEAVAAGIEARYPGARVLRGQQVSDNQMVITREAAYESARP